MLTANISVLIFETVLALVVVDLGTRCLLCLNLMVWLLVVFAWTEMRQTGNLRGSLRRTHRIDEEVLVLLRNLSL